MSKPEIIILPDLEAIAHRAADRFVSAARVAIADRGTFTAALSGGSTPKPMFELLATPDYASKIDWARVEIYFIDERAVPPTHAESNYKLAHDSLLGKVPIPLGNVHRMLGEVDAEDSAVMYGRLLKTRFGDGGVDFALLGMGGDGHTASMFPHSIAAREKEHRVVGQFVENSTTGRSWRITTTAPFINRSGEIIVLMADASKADRLQQVLYGPRDPDAMPMQLIAPASGKMTWLVTPETAGKLPA